MARDCTVAQRLTQLMDVGATTATAIVAMAGNGRDFDSGRQFAAWLGLVPWQYSSGGKPRLGRITKAGDGYLRSLLVMGAKAVLNAAPGKHDSLSRWALAVRERCGYSHFNHPSPRPSRQREGSPNDIPEDIARDALGSGRHGHTPCTTTGAVSVLARKISATA